MAIAEDDSDSHRRARVPRREDENRSHSHRRSRARRVRRQLAELRRDAPSSRRSIRWPSPPSRSAAQSQRHEPDSARRRAARPRALRQRHPHDRGRRPRPLPRAGLPACARGRDRLDVGARGRPPRARARPATLTSGSIRSGTPRSQSGSARSSTAGPRPNASRRGFALSTATSAAASRAASATRSSPATLRSATSPSDTGSSR